MDGILHHLRNPGMMVAPVNTNKQWWCRISCIHSIKRSKDPTRPAKHRGDLVADVGVLRQKPNLSRAECWVTPDGNPLDPNKWAVFTLPPTNMEVQKGPFQEESSLSTGVCALPSKLVGGYLFSPKGQMTAQVEGVAQGTHQ